MCKSFKIHQLTAARWNIPATGPSSFASLSRFSASLSDLISHLETTTLAPNLSKWCIFFFWYPVLTPERDVKMRFFAPLITNHLANSKPNPPRPPNKTKWTLTNNKCTYIHVYKIPIWSQHNYVIYSFKYTQIYMNVDFVVWEHVTKEWTPILLI